MEELSNLDELLRNLADGHRDAFTQVFQLLWLPTLQVCTRLMGNEADGADAAQIAMLRIFERASEYDRARPALPWALGIASWECRTLLKQRSRRREAPDALIVESDEGDGAAAQEQRLLVAAAFTAIGTLSELDQETLVATYWDAAAEASGPTQRKRRSRALGRLRDAFRRLYGLD